MALCFQKTAESLGCRSGGTQRKRERKREREGQFVSVEGSRRGGGLYDLAVSHKMKHI